MDQQTLLETIITNTQNTKAATTLIDLTIAEGLDRRTLDMALGVATSSEDTPYDAANFKNLTYNGEFIGQGTSEPTGQSIYAGIILKNKKNGKTITLGLDTGIKLASIGKRSGVLSLPTLDALLEQKEEAFEPTSKAERDYVDTLQAVLDDKEKIKAIQSTTEKRQVKGLIGLKEAKEDIEDSIKELFTEYLFSEHLNAEKINTYAAQLLIDSGTHLKRLKERYDTLPSHIKGKLDMVTAGRKLLTPKKYFLHQQDLRAYDAMTSPIHNTGKAKEYIDDLRTIVEEGSTLPKAAKLLEDIKSFQAGIGFSTPAKLAALFDDYDLAGERLRRVKERVDRNDEYAADLARGKTIIRTIFIKENDYTGGKDNVPQTITKEQEHITKRGDQAMRRAQAWARADYFSQAEEDAYAATSMRSNEERLDALVLLARRSKAATRMVDDQQRLAEDFPDQYGITLQEFINRMSDIGRFSHIGTDDWRKEKKMIIEESKIGLYIPERFSALERLIATMRDEYQPIMEEERKMIDEYRDLRMIANNTPGHYLESITMLQGQTYIEKAKKETIKTALENDAKNIRAAHERFQKRMNNPQRTFPATISAITDKYKQASPDESFNIKYKGSTYDDRKDFDNAFPRTWWNPDDKTRNRTYEKRSIPGVLKRIREYNRNHEHKITIAIT